MPPLSRNKRTRQDDSAQTAGSPESSSAQTPDEARGLRTDPELRREERARVPAAKLKVTGFGFSTCTAKIDEKHTHVVALKLFMFSK